MRCLSRLLGLVSAQTFLHPAGRSVIGPLTHRSSFSAFAAAHQRQEGGALLVLHPASQSQYSLQEACRLAESLAGTAPDFVEVGSASRLRPSPATFFGRGQVDAVQTRIAATQPERVFVNHVLSGVQQRNLERAFQRPVLDRVALIIEIFSRRARTAEARLQVELASLEYKASRLVRLVDASTGRRTAFGLAGDASEIVSARERGRSGSGTGGLGGAGGQGESELQLQRRRIAERRKQLLRRLEEVRKTRAVQRAARRRSGKPQVAIVGYTNAGKSSLLSALSKCGAAVAGVEDRLFATLDPTLRRVMLPGSGADAILSDTVGFIADLPTQLIEAFKATLEEVTEADLLLHVLDASSPQVLQQRQAVLEVLRELGVTEQRLREQVLEVWNKVDLLPAAAGRDKGDGQQLIEWQQLGEQQGGQQEMWVAARTPHEQEQMQQQCQPEQHQEQHEERHCSQEAVSLVQDQVEAAPQPAPGKTSHDSLPGSRGSPKAAGKLLSKENCSGSGLVHSATFQLPSAVAALFKADPAAAQYRPTAVAASVLHGQGLPELLAVMDAKLQVFLGHRPQRSRRSTKKAAAGLLQGQEEEAVRQLSLTASGDTQSSSAARRQGQQSRQQQRQRLS